MGTSRLLGSPNTLPVVTLTWTRKPGRFTTSTNVHSRLMWQKRDLSTDLDKPSGSFAKSLDWIGLDWTQGFLLYLPTKTPFLIGQERVTCHELKQSNSPGRTKLTNSIGKQQLSTLTCSGRAP